MSTVHICSDAAHGAVRVDRTTRWGNPFRIGPDGTRADVIAKYRVSLWAQIKAEPMFVFELAELAGRDLACWCAPQPCHADVLGAAARWAAELLDEAQIAAAESGADRELDHDAEAFEERWVTAQLAK